MKLYILFLVLVGLSGCSGDHPGAPDTPLSVAPSVTAQGSGEVGRDGAIVNPLSQKEWIVENGRMVQAAAELFAARNGGWYPANLIDVNLDGMTLVDLLPGGQLLENPVTGVRHLPVDGPALGPGETGYMGLWAQQRAIRGYWIEGTGQAGPKIVEIKRSVDGSVTETAGRLEPTLDDFVLENCLVVAAAAEAYAADNAGDFPDGRADLVPYLPNASYLTNPSTGAETEPVGWEPGGPGSTSYNTLRDFEPYTLDPLTDGYRVVGRGEHGDFVVSNHPVVINKEQAAAKNCLAVRTAAEAFTVDNGGEYPATVNQRNALGKRLTDYLPGGRLLVNPFLQMHTEPVDGPAASLGSTGFMPCDWDGDGRFDGYTIDGLGSSYFPVYQQSSCP